MTQREMRERAIASMLSRQNGLKLIAQSMTQPLQKFRDYESIGRQAILVETLGQGEDPLLDVDITSSVAYEVADLGNDILTLINPETIRPNTKEIAANPEVSYSQLKARKFDVKARIEAYSRAEIFRVEDRAIFNGLLAAATHEYYRPVYQTDKNRSNGIFTGQQKVTLPGNPVNTPVAVPADDINISAISAAMAQIEKHGAITPTNLFMNPMNNQILRNINVNNVNGFYVDFDTSREIMSKGYLGTVYGLNVFTSPEIPTDVILVTGEPELTGRLVERLPLTVIPYEDAKARRSGFSIFEEVGIVVHNPAAVAAIKILK